MNVDGAGWFSSSMPRHQGLKVLSRRFGTAVLAAPSRHISRVISMRLESALRITCGCGVHGKSSCAGTAI